MAARSWNGESCDERAQRLASRGTPPPAARTIVAARCLRSSGPGHGRRSSVSPARSTVEHALDPGPAAARARRSSRSSHALDAAAPAHDGHESLGVVRRRDLDAPAPSRPASWRPTTTTPSATRTSRRATRSPIRTSSPRSSSHPDHRATATSRHALLDALVADAAAAGATARRALAATARPTPIDDALDRASASSATSEQYQMRVPAPARRVADVARRRHRARVRARAATTPRGCGSTTARSRTTPTRAAGSRRRSRAGWPSRGSTRPGSCSRSTRRRPRRFCWTKVHDAEPRRGRRRDLRDRRRPRRTRAPGSGARSTVGGLEHLATRAAVPDRDALRRRRQPARARPVPVARLHGAPHRPRVRAGRPDAP